MVDRDYQNAEDELSRTIFDLLVKEPFYAHVLASMPRVIGESVKTIGLFWNGQQVELRVNPTWFHKKLTAKQKIVVLKHEVLHVVFRHIFRQNTLIPEIYSIACDLVVNQLLDPHKPLSSWPTIETIKVFEFEPDKTAMEYYNILAKLFKNPKKKSEQSSDEDVLSSAGGLISDDSGWHNGNDAMNSAAGRYSIGSILIRAKERLGPHQWGSLPASLLSELDLILAERQPKVDWKRIIRIFCSSTGRTRIRHTIKKVSKRYGTRPGIKIQRLKRLLVAIDTSGSINQELLKIFFTEIHAAWRLGAKIDVIECDAAIGNYYLYKGRAPTMISGGGGTEFEPVFKWMKTQRPFDGVIYLTDGCGPNPTTRPNCKLLWVVYDNPENSSLPFGPTVSISLNER